MVVYARGGGVFCALLSLALAVCSGHHRRGVINQCLPAPRIDVEVLKIDL